MFCDVRACNAFLAERHYLGEANARFGWWDEFGVMLFMSPRSRRLPNDWLELVRWCLIGTPNGGSQQWARFVRAARPALPAVTTIVSYSDPSQGHTGALYRACNWQWAPTWLRLRTPPTGNGAWKSGGSQEAKDRWVYPLRPDDRRRAALAVNDDALMKRMPWASYPGDYKRFAELRR